MWRKKEIFCIFINVFSVTFNLFKAALLNKCANLFQKVKENLTEPKLLNDSVTNISVSLKTVYDVFIAQEPPKTWGRC